MSRGNRLIAWLLLRPRILAVVVILAVISSLYGVYRFNEWREARSLAHYKAENAALKADNAALSVALEREKASEHVVVKYVDRLQVVAGRTQTIIREVPVYVTPEADARCVIPVGFVRLHDSAAEGRPVEPTGTPDAPAEGVSLSTVTETVVGNYGAAHENAEQLRALQDWIRAQQAIH